MSLRMLSSRIAAYPLKSATARLRVCSDECHIHADARLVIGRNSAWRLVRDIQKAVLVLPRQIRFCAIQAPLNRIHQVGLAEAIPAHHQMEISGMPLWQTENSLPVLAISRETYLINPHGSASARRQGLSQAHRARWLS